MCFRMHRVVYNHVGYYSCFWKTAISMYILMILSYFCLTTILKKLTCDKPVPSSSKKYLTMAPSTWPESIPFPETLPKKMRTDHQLTDPQIQRPPNKLTDYDNIISK